MNSQEKRNSGKRFFLVLLPCLALIPIFYVASLALTTIQLTQQVPIYRSIATLEFPPPQKDESPQQFQVRIRNLLVNALSSDIISKAARNIDMPVDAREKLQEVQAEPIAGTSDINLRVDSLDPVLGSDYANSWASTFLASLPPEQQAQSKLIQRARPAAYPITPRKLSTIRNAALIGVAAGFIAALLLALFITLALNKRQAKRVAGVGP